MNSQLELEKSGSVRRGILNWNLFELMLLLPGQDLSMKWSAWQIIQKK